MRALIAEEVTRRYGARRVVDRASLTLAPGAVTALLGGSGAGKSTLLRLFAGLEQVDEGRIVFGEETLSQPGRTVQPEKRRVGLVFQDFALFPHLTALDNVRFGLNALNKDAQISVAGGWLNRLGLARRAAAYPHELSGGEQQRVAIARALAPQPVAMLMDEPFSGLDQALRESVRDEALAAIREAGVPALLVTHDAREAMISADTLSVMRDGRIKQTGAPEDVYTTPVDLQTMLALGPANVLVAAIKDGALATAFGPFDQAMIMRNPIVAVREEGLLLDPDGKGEARVVGVTRTGPFVRVALESQGERAFALVAPQRRPAVGETVRTRIDPERAFIFDAGA